MPVDCSLAYVDMNFDNSAIKDQSSSANLGAGLKYAFILDAVSRTAVSGTMTF